MSVEYIIKKHAKEYEKILEETKTKQKEKSEIILREWISKNKNSGIYKIKIWRNGAETSKNIDYISVLEEKYFDNINSAIDFSKSYIKEHFINPDGFRIIGKNLICCDICSWGETIELKRIEVI